MAADEGSAPLLDWLDDPFLPSFLNEPDTYSIADNDCEWWAQSDPIINPAHVLHLPQTAASAAASPSGPTTVPILSPPTELPKKRRRWGEENDTTNSSDSGEINRKQPVIAGRKSSGKVPGGSSSNNSSSKEARWAEQLLNPLAAAIDANNLSRVQHLLYVLQELASPSGDANHRLASHGLRALTHHISAPLAAVEGSPAPTFATTEPKQFRLALIRFNEVSPWFAFPNSLANASILQALNLDTPQRRRRNLHVVDIGVSHGIQWPTMLEALTRRPSGAPQLVRLTEAGGAVPQGPFSSPPHGYDFSSHLLRYAKTIDLNLRIERAADLTPASLGVDRDEVLVVCAQFRAHHCEGEQRAALLRSVRGLDPDLVILTEVEGGEREAAGFARRAEVLWRFLDSTSAAFKGRDCAERRVVEGEMARVLERGGGEELGEGRERWRERMLGLGFQEEGFGEEAVDGGRALLRKYDSNWEMRTALDSAVGIGLWWKGQPVSFCSIWKTTKV